MTDLTALIDKLVTANHVLAHEDVVDAFGHITVRHPDNPERFFMSRSRSPELVEASDIVEFDLDCEPQGPYEGRLYSERPIHGTIYAARPDVMSVVHHHSYKVVPFSVSTTPLKPMLHVAARIGEVIPVWDIRDKFGDTNMLVTTLDQGRDLAATLGDRACVLMRGHGAAVAGSSIEDAVITSLYLQVNAQLQMDALRLGEVTYLTPGEVEIGGVQRETGMDRAWEYLCRRAEGG